MESTKIKNLVKNALIITNHAYEKMLQENITKKDILEVLLSGKDSKVDFSKRNNKSFAWNQASHNTITHNDITVVFCNSREHACLVISVYHGFPHNFMSNVYNQKRFY
jgi:hypothetical protein